MKFLTSAAVVAATALAVFPSAAGSSAANSGTFADPAGDAGGAPDVTSLTISDSAAGVIQFAFSVTGMTTDAAVFVFMDTDRNAATGNDGDDYEVDVSIDSKGTWYDVSRYDGAKWVSVPETPTMGMSVSGSTYTVRVGRADLGGTTGFEFWALSALWKANDIAAADRVPDTGTLVYELSKATAAPPVTTTPPPSAVVPWIGKPTLSQAPHAGSRVTVTFPVTNKTTGQPLTSGTMTCDPQVDGQVLRHVESFGNGAAKLTFTIPKTSKGKTLKVNLTIRAGAKSAHTVATFKVK